MPADAANEARAAWARRFSDALSNPGATEMPVFATAAKQAGELFEALGDDRTALDYYLASMQAPNSEGHWRTRLESGEAAVRLAAVEFQSADLVFTLLEEYRFISQQAPGNDFETVARQIQSDHLEGQYLVHLATGLRERMRSEASVDPAEVAGVLMAAADSFDRYLSRLRQNPLAEEVLVLKGSLDRHQIHIESTAFARADALSSAAALLDTTGDGAGAAELHGRAARAYEAMFEQFPTSLSAESRVLACAAAQYETMGVDAWTEFMGSFARELPPGHGILSYLHKVGTQLSNDDASLVGSNKVFDLLIALEREWFPAEYEDHVNYQ